MQIFTMRYNLEFRKLTLYGITRPQSIRKSKQISGQTILSSPQDLEFNPNFAKNRDIPVVKNSVIYTRPVTPEVLTTDTLETFYLTLITCQIPAPGGGRGTRPIFGYRWAAEGLKPWPCLGQKIPKIHTLFRTTLSILVPCLGQQPQFYYPIVHDTPCL